jgi:hypothetical protein
VEEHLVREPEREVGRCGMLVGEWWVEDDLRLGEDGGGDADDDVVRLDRAPGSVEFEATAAVVDPRYRRREADVQACGVAGN